MIAILVFLSGCAADRPCSSKIIHKSLDPTSERFAVIEVRNCGATTDYTTVIRVGRTPEGLDSAEEVFVADSNRGKAAPGEKNAILIEIVWTPTGKLLVNHALDARIFKQLTMAKSATISYRATEPVPPPPVPAQVVN